MRSVPFPSIQWLKENVQPRIDTDSSVGSLSAPHWSQRDTFVKKFSWAILTKAACKHIILAAPQPILAVGSGLGYNESRLKLLGADIIATDVETPPNPYMDVYPYKAVDAVKSFANAKTLMFCWPCYDDNWAHEALRAFRGTHVVYIGEGLGGCTADDAFHEELEAKWNMEERYIIPQWCGIHDALRIYRSKYRG